MYMKRFQIQRQMTLEFWRFVWKSRTDSALVTHHFMSEVIFRDPLK